ncbi:TRAP dicarboxylate transporter- DctP subunit [Alkaliphilus metalliredigens QYMF]|uniref:TRAP dicarboxylate transporter-DctP subunit n=1 Tax=Alkaliphilus metalliredigens (strain QYMF) TaxID=293826 RepID=A6TLW8_ALKMQ|nr:C4-dicarboxylate TRAP transporter substrate-binding protein [Alkaliphilus metalliredigens]ABR47186.1 TRAP dicarboxylate transporter- DctP subunit [Alkaliphilus metalliredigens QYMF]
MKKFWTILLVLAMTLTLAACGGNEADAPAGDVDADAPAANGEKKVIMVSTKFVDDEQTAISLKKVVEDINERSEGSLELQLFTGGILPIGKDGMEQIVQGSDWILVDGINFLGDYVPDYNAVTGPFLYQTFDEYLAMTQTDLVQNLNEQLEQDHGVKVLSLDWVFGFRSMMTNKPIQTPDDMNGLNIRVPTSQLYTYTIEAMGGNPVSMPYPDTYAAIQQGVINGVEGSIMTYYGTQQYENVKEYSLTNHLLGVSAVTISPKLWDALTEEQQTIIAEEFQKGMEENLVETIRLEKEYEVLLKEEGVNFHEVDADAFLRAAAPVYTKFDRWTPGIYEELVKELEIIKENLK